MSIRLMTILLVLVFVIGIPRPAHAYLDPGTGSYTAQVMLAGVMVALFSLRSFFRGVIEKITSLFKSHQE